MSKIKTPEFTLPNSEGPRNLGNLPQKTSGALSTTALGPALWHTRAEESKGIQSLSGNSGIDAAGGQEGYMIHELPTSLPISTRESRTPNEQDRRIPWSEIPLEERAYYLDTSAVDPSSAAFDSRVPFDLLTPDTKQTLLADRSFDIHSKSQDPGEQQRATERNTERVRHGKILQPGDLIHTAPSGNLAGILDTGLMGIELLGEDIHRGKSANWAYNLHATQLTNIPPEINESTYPLIIGKAERYANYNIGIIIDRAEGSTDHGQEFYPSANSGIGGHTLIFGGVPSTEIAAICTLPPEDNFTNAGGRGEHDAEQATLSAIDAILTHGQYIPVLDHKGKLALTREEFDERRADHDYGNFSYKEFEPFEPELKPAVIW